MEFPFQLGMFFKWWIMGKGLKPSSNKSPEDTLTGVEFIVLVLIVLALLFLVYYLITKALERRANRLKLTDPLSASGCRILSKSSTFYAALSKKDKVQFERRVQYFINAKLFTASEGYVATEEMKVLIAAASTQITFGLTARSNSNFNHIHISVGPQENQQLNQSMRNSIQIYWKDFVEGFATPDDGKNEGLKAIAIALIRDYHLQDKGYKLFSEKKYRQWEQAANEEQADFMGGIFFNFNTDNKKRNDYFAHSIVYFFELPQAMKIKYPKNYKSLCVLLNQKPIR